MKLIEKMGNDAAIAEREIMQKILNIDEGDLICRTAAYQNGFKAGFIAAKEMATKVVDAYTFSADSNGSRVTEGRDILDEIKGIGEKEV